MTQCKIGDVVRAKAEDSRAVEGIVIGESYGGTCWEIEHERGMSSYNKAYCTLLPRRNQMSMAARHLQTLWKIKHWDGQGDI